MNFQPTFAPQHMHIPDGFILNPVVLLVGWVLAISFIGMALAKTRNQLGEKQIPLMGVLAAFIFAAQALNFPVAFGTSGHLLGAALAAIVMGPWAAVLIMASVFGLQAVLFQDGGLAVLGWNIVNMGVIGAFTGYFTYQTIRRLMGDSRASLLIAGAIGGWLSVMLGAVATSVELAVSGTAALAITLPAMAAVHAVIGIGEAIITDGALLFISAVRPELLDQSKPGTRTAAVVGVGLVVALALAVISPLAIPNPDGLERVAEDTGFLSTAQAPAFTFLPDYTAPGVQDQALTTVLAVGIGTLLVFVIAVLIGRFVTRRKVTTS